MRKATNSTCWELLIGNTNVQCHWSSLLNGNPSFFKCPSNVLFKRIGVETWQILRTKVKRDRVHADELRVNGSSRFRKRRESGGEEHGSYDEQLRLHRQSLSISEAVASHHVGIRMARTGNGAFPVSACTALAEGTGRSTATTAREAFLPAA